MAKYHMEIIEPEQGSNEFTRNSLEKCFELLRENSPSLAILIQNALMECDQRFPESQVSLKLDESTVNHIVAKLAEIGEATAVDTSAPKNELIKIRSILMDWMVYAQSFQFENQETSSTDL
jgi:hypothetical protein